MAAESRLKKYPLHTASTSLVVMAGKGALGLGRGLDDVAETVARAVKLARRCLGRERAGWGSEVILMIDTYFRNDFHSRRSSVVPEARESVSRQNCNAYNPIFVSSLRSIHPSLLDSQGPLIILDPALAVQNKSRANNEPMAIPPLAFRSSSKRNQE